MAVVWPSVFVTDTSTCGVSVSTSVETLLEPFGSDVPPGGETVAVFESVPVAEGSTVPEATNRTWPPPAPTFTAVLMLPDPPAGHEVDPGDPTVRTLHVHVTPVNAAGNVSATTAAMSQAGP